MKAWSEMHSERKRDQDSTLNFEWDSRDHTWILIRCLIDRVETALTETSFQIKWTSR